MHLRRYLNTPETRQRINPLHHSQLIIALLQSQATRSPLTPPFTARPIPPIPPIPPTKSLGASPTLDATQQQILENVASIPLTALESLPTIAGSQNDLFSVKDDIEKFLQLDLDLARLNKIHTHLWMAGRPMRARPLHRYRMLGLEVLPTQQMDLHLLRFSSRLILKPLAEYMLDHDFWTAHICADESLHKSACGFLTSYVWLLTTPIDLKIAHELFLVPTFVTWTWWKTFVEDVSSHINLLALDQVNQRFHYGELRLSRINSIYRIRFGSTHFVRGYLYGYNRYVVFFERKFGWILIVFVFFSLVLAAMQVGASVDPIQDNKKFIASCFGFVVFSIVAVAAILGVVGALFLFIFLYNMVRAIRHVGQEAKKRESQPKVKKEV